MDNIYHLDTLVNTKLFSKLEHFTKPIPLMSTGGINSLEFAIVGPMQPTAMLKQYPLLQQTLQELAIPLSRTYLVNIQDTFSPYSRCNYHHWQHFTWYLSSTRLQLSYKDKTCIINPFQWVCVEKLLMHQLTNIDNVKNAYLLVAESLASPENKQVETIAFKVFDNQSFQKLIQALPLPSDQIVTLQTNWQQTFDKYGYNAKGELAYQNIILKLQDFIKPYRPKLTTEQRCILEVLTTLFDHQPRKIKAKPSFKPLKKLQENTDIAIPEFDRPVFIVSAPRAGSTLLFETLMKLPDLWSIASESHEVIESIPTLHPSFFQYQSNILTAKQASTDIVNTLKKSFAIALQNNKKEYYQSIEDRPNYIRFLEKTPKNALRIPFLQKAFPNAYFIFLYRDPWANISSLIEGWRSRRFIAYDNLYQVHDWPYRDWSFLLVPNWYQYKAASLAEIAAYQWYSANHALYQHLQKNTHCFWLNYQDLVDNSEKTIKNIINFIEIDNTKTSEIPHLQPSCMTLSAPDPNKWKRHQLEIEAAVEPYLSFWKQLSLYSSC